LKRGETWTVAGAKDYANKPRPAVILQDDQFDGTEFITIRVMTQIQLRPLFRVGIAPNERTGLDTLSRLTVDKIIGSGAARDGADTSSDCPRNSHRVPVFSASQVFIRD
jgi:mRNA interferase MazF